MDDDKVVHFQKVEDSPNGDVVQQLEYLLAEAKAGRVWAIGWAAVTRTPSGSPGVSQSAVVEAHYVPQLTFGLRDLESSLMEFSRKQAYFMGLNVNSPTEEPDADE